MIFSLITKRASSEVISEFNRIAHINVTIFVELALENRFPKTIDDDRIGIAADEDAFAYGAEMVELINHHSIYKDGLTAIDRVKILQGPRRSTDTAYTAGAYSLLMSIASLEHMATEFYQYYRKDDQIFEMINTQMMVMAPVLTRMFHYFSLPKLFQNTFPKVSEAVDRSRTL